MSETRVIHVSEMDRFPDAVYIGRAMPRRGLMSSTFHNPYRIGKDGTRQQVIRLYRDRFEQAFAMQPEFWTRRLQPLVGKPLACWCRRDGQERTEANACHADVLIDLIHKLGLEDTDVR